MAAKQPLASTFVTPSNPRHAARTQVLPALAAGRAPLPLGMAPAAERRSVRRPGSVFFAMLVGLICPNSSLWFLPDASAEAAAIWRQRDLTAAYELIGDRPQGLKDFGWLYFENWNYRKQAIVPPRGWIALTTNGEDEVQRCMLKRVAGEGDAIRLEFEPCDGREFVFSGEFLNLQHFCTHVNSSSGTKAVLRGVLASRRNGSVEVSEKVAFSCFVGD